MNKLSAKQNAAEEDEAETNDWWIGLDLISVFVFISVWEDTDKELGWVKHEEGFAFWWEVEKEEKSKDTKACSKKEVTYAGEWNGLS